ncbi:MAG: hypothetical protein AB7S96_02250 [Candidatus Izemoplasmatales bacterium]
MRKLLKIADIFIDFTYNYDEYFKDTLDKYEVEDESKDYHKIIIKVEKDIEIPKREKTLIYKNRYKMENEEDTFIISETPKGVKHKIYFTNDYKLIKITINELLKDRLAEFEYVLSGMMFFEVAAKLKYLPVHASCIFLKGKTFLLSGPSRAGKSTQTKYFVNAFSESKVINEDKPIIFYRNKKVYVSGTPWSGKDVINTNIIKPLDYIFFLEQGNETSIVSLTKEEKIKALFRNIHRPSDSLLVDNTFEIINKLIDLTPMYKYVTVNNESSSKELYRFIEEGIL